MRTVSLLVALGVGACSSAPPPPPPTPTEAPTAAGPAVSSQAPADEATESTEASPSEATPESLEMPTACAGGDEICTPPESFAKQLCLRSIPDLAFAMFKKDTPWTRAYARFPVKAWYAGGGHTAPAELLRNEELIIVASRTSGRKGGPRVVGAGSYDVYRWDGSCVSVQSDEVTTQRLGMVQVAPIPWRDLRDAARDALLEDKGIAFRNKMRRQLCKGAQESTGCKNNRVAMSLLIAEFVRGGGDVPIPELSAL